MAACAAMAACGSDEPSPTGGEEKGELRLLVSVPDRATRAIGDPGDEPQEADMWDRVSVIATFPAGKRWNGKSTSSRSTVQIMSNCPPQWK